jgi:hypothetical protein
MNPHYQDIRGSIGDFLDILMSDIKEPKHVESFPRDGFFGDRSNGSFQLERLAMCNAIKGQ